ncbi:chromosome X 36 [Cichlidogyrus casuarinus]|uniref:Chromosome X 36 n=1 Tax=Cichlidogyrus casuarinus TaxID=1844966 RepID=A0ABD2QJW6_9PLAT
MNEEDSKKTLLGGRSVDRVDFRKIKKRRPLLFKVAVAGLILCLLIGLILGIKLMLVDNPTLGEEFVQLKRCPGCFGQSACPLFLRGDVRLPGLFGSKALHHLKSSFRATIGLERAAYPVLLRRISSPADQKAVDEAVCRRGLRSGAAHAPEMLLKTLKCLPNLAIWRWRPTGTPDDSNSIF